MENAEVRKPKYGNESTPVIFQNAIQLIMGKKDAVLITDFGVGTTARSLVRTATEINHIHSIFKHAHPILGVQDVWYSVLYLVALDKRVRFQLRTCSLYK